MQTEAQKRATQKYLKENVHQFAVRFYPADAETWEWLSSQENKQGYVRELIRQDMERKKNS